MRCIMPNQPDLESVLQTFSVRFETRISSNETSAVHLQPIKHLIFSVCAPPPPPSLVGAYYLQPPDARAIFLHNDLLCNDTCSVTGGSITYWGAETEKIPNILTNQTYLIGSLINCNYADQLIDCGDFYETSN